MAAAFLSVAAAWSFTRCAALPDDRAEPQRSEEALGLTRTGFGPLALRLGDQLGEVAGGHEPLLQEQTSRLLYRQIRWDGDHVAHHDVSNADALLQIPILRGVRRTAPYFHDNSAKTLEEVMDHYEQFFLIVSGGFLALTSQEKADMVAFMKLL